MRDSSWTRPWRSSTHTLLCTAVPGRPLATSRCRSAKAATCGRWVTQMTWRCRPSTASRRPTSSAASPPIPASTSSKIMLAGPSPPRAPPRARARPGTTHRPKRFGPAAEGQGRHPAKRAARPRRRPRHPTHPPSADAELVTANFESGRGHRQGGQLGRHPARQTGGPRSAGRAQQLRERQHLLCRLLLDRSQL